MSAIFIIKYAGSPLRIKDRFVETVAEDRLATEFMSQADAWLAVHQNHLTAKHCQVVKPSNEN